MGMLTSKVPLIIIVAPKSCIVNRQCGVGDSKYVVTFDPLPSGHVRPPGYIFVKMLYNGEAQEQSALNHHRGPLKVVK